MKSLKTLKEELDAMICQLEQGPWYPAAGGTEKPFFTKSGRKLLYCYQPGTGSHAYLDMGTDIFLSDDEACREMGR